MKNILLIAILLLTSLAAKAEDYYDIPAGWEKIVEFESKLQNLHLVAKNKLIYLGYQNIYSTNGGISFDSLKIINNISGSKSFIIDDYLYLANYSGIYLYKFDPFQNTIDTVKENTSSSKYLVRSYDKAYVNKEESNIVLVFEERGTKFSFDKGKTWVDIYLNHLSDQFNLRGDNYYSFLFDWKNTNRWLYYNFYDSDCCIDYAYFKTEDNGKSFQFIKSPIFTLNVNSKFTSFPETGVSDKYLGFDNSNSVISINYTKFKNPNINALPSIFYKYNGFKFIDIYKNEVVSSFNMDSIMANYLKVDSVYEGAVSIDKDFYLTKGNKILFMSNDNLQSKSKDTIFQKMFLFDYKTMKLEQLLDRKIPTIKDASFYSNSILHFDYSGGYVYYDLTAPQKPNELQKKIIIRRKIQDATSIETESEKLESICMQNGKIVFEKEYQNPTIEIIDMVGKSFGYKILSTNPLTIEPNPNTTKGAYFLKIKDNQEEKNYKFILE